MLSKKLKQILIITNISLASAALGASSALADDDSNGITEARVQGQLWGTYAVNSELNPFDLEIDVSGETVTLTGEVDNQAKKELAEEIALGVNGVARVNNQIRVEPELERRGTGDQSDRSFGQVVSDATTTATIKSKMLLDDDVAGLDINVSTENNVVTLQGEAETAIESRRAESLASETDGVVRVVNRIAVR